MKQTQRKKHKIILVALVMMLVTASLVCAFAALNSHAAPSVDVTFPVRQNVTSNTGNEATREFTYRITPANPSNPMPAGTVGGVYDFTITGNQQVNIPAIRFTELGDFVYEVRAVVSNRVGHVYDTRVYNVIISIMNSPTGDGLNYTIILQDGDNTNAPKPEAIVFNHSYQLDMVTISGAKTWDHGTNPVANRPTSITVRLMDGETQVASAVVRAADHWSWSFVVPRLRTDGTEIQYTITEDPIAGYEPHINGFNITNIHESVGDVPPSYITLQGEKTWTHGTNPVSGRPSSIVVLVLQGDTVVRRIPLTAADGWRWTTTVPEFDANGNRITYRVFEENVPMYTVTVNGMNMNNRFVNQEFPGDTPQTGEDNTMLIGAALAGFSLIGIILIVFKRRNNEVEEVL